jgi:uncharacterized protein DUF1707
MSAMVNLPDGAKDPRELRAADSDRDGVAAVLREAAAEGRLSLDELDERLTAVYAAKTYAELEPITRDLPDTGAAPSAAPVAARDGGRFGGAPTSRAAIAVMSGFVRKGRWGVPPAFTSVAFWGGGELDLREARFTEPQVTIRAFAVMGGINVIVPDDADVVVGGIGIMGGFDHRAAGEGAPEAPRIIIKGFAFCGGVGVERKPRKSELKRLKAERKRAEQERLRELE